MVHGSVSERRDGVDAVSRRRAAPAGAKAALAVESLLDAAARLLDEVGQHRLTTTAVAEAAGVSVGTLYRYFPDRVALLGELRRRSAAGLRARVLVVAGLVRPGTDRDRARLVAEELIRSFATEPGFAIGSGEAGDPVEARIEAFERMLFVHSLLEAGRIAGGGPADRGALLIDRARAMDVALTLLHALAASAFRLGDEPDPLYLDEMERVIEASLVAEQVEASGALEGAR